MTRDPHRPLLETRDLAAGIGERRFCDGLNLAIGPGQCWGLLGRNGAGKTTLLHTLAGLRAPLNGRILLEGADLAGLPRRQVARRLGLLLQERDARFPMRVLDAVLAGRHPHLGPWEWPGPTDRDAAVDILDRLGLPGLADRNVQTLSGGERQRVAIATLLVQAPAVLLLDEPVSHLDLREQMRVLRLLSDLAQQGHGVLMSLHDPNQALGFCDHLLLLDQGRVEVGPLARCGTPERLSRLYGLSLMALNGPRGPLVVPE